VNGERPIDVVTFDELPAHATPLAGGKGASLARMRQAGLAVPRGFVVAAEAFGRFLARHGIDALIAARTAKLDVDDRAALESAAGDIRGAIAGATVSGELGRAIRDAYARLATSGDAPFVAVRSSALSEDSDSASFAGQQETFLNVRGADAVITRLQDCWASFFSPRALFYRAEKGALSDMRMAVVVQEMVRADKSGVMFTVDPIEKRRDRMVIEAVFGLGEGIVSGVLTPDHYVLDRDDGTIVREFVAVQTTLLTCDGEAGGIRQVELSEDDGGARVLSDAELGELRAAGLTLESFFGSPQDVEWSIRGGELLLLQSRPITTL
jgi:pyruvate,water dikinase